MIIRGGENIPVAYVENVLYENPDIAAVAVVGLPDPRLQERACAVVVLKPGVRRGSRWTTCARSSPRRAWPGSTGPSGWSCCPELPRTASGKIQKFKLREAGREEHHDAQIDAPRTWWTGCGRRSAATAARLSAVRPGRPGRARGARALTGRLPSVDWDAVDDVVLGCANQAGEDNRNVARMAALLAGLPVDVPGTTVNRLCGSGLDAVAIAARAVRSGDADLVIAGGVESMSRAPFVHAQGRRRRSPGPPRSTTPPSAGGSSTR